MARMNTIEKNRLSTLFRRGTFFGNFKNKMIIGVINKTILNKFYQIVTSTLSYPSFTAPIKNNPFILKKESYILK